MKNNNPFIVTYITFKKTRLIDHVNKYYPEMDVYAAKKIAEENGLNLVCFNKPDLNNLAFCKIIDYGKWKYSEEKSKKKQEKLNRKDVKEIRFSPEISDHDIEHKLKQVEEFINDGDDVIFSMRLKGRQKSHFDLAELKMNEIISKCSEYCKEISKRKGPSLITVRMGKNNKVDN